MTSSVTFVKVWNINLWGGSSCGARWGGSVSGQTDKQTSASAAQSSERQWTDKHQRLGRCSGTILHCTIIFVNDDKSGLTNSTFVRWLFRVRGSFAHPDFDSWASSLRFQTLILSSSLIHIQVTVHYCVCFGSINNRCIFFLWVLMCLYCHMWIVNRVIFPLH